MDVIDRASAELMGRLPGMERVRLACALGDSLRRMVKHHLRTKHPDWTQEQILRELLRRAGAEAPARCEDFLGGHGYTKRFSQRGAL